MSSNGITDLIGDKWSLLFLREMFLGTTLFNRFQRALPRRPPSIFSKRLKMLEVAGIIVRKTAPAGRVLENKLTRSGREHGPIIEGMAIWGVRWRSRRIKALNYDVGGFMRDFHRTLKTQGLPDGQTVFLDGPSYLVTNAPDWFSQSPMIDIRPVDCP